ncbi:transporter [Candidatus Rickettsiella isopodorum]|jgi:EmrB/QacA subfamily drug resistance transporter|uniref:Transporter n=1 Tax=Candidatus Rickettsiella isopodorum TaxID=1225476 RepID=A0A1J8PCJ9_9COXI|nr:MFS transporter [Candidatus Rickettsiella isopodorum]OIZ95079.1 transporter [Candidatus Rickettsiella isopodorum]
MLKFTEKNRKWWILLAMSSSLALVFIDQTALAVALPAIQRELNLSNSLTQWVINAYLLALSAIILLGGKIGDRLGHKRAFLFGVTVFVLASVLSALAESGGWLITMRAIQGIGGAFMMPSTNALVTNAFPDKERGKALGIYVALAAIFLALGPLLGGFLTQVFSWRAVFWINFPIALISIFLAISSVPGWTRTEKLNIDWLGFFISILFISGFVLGFMEGPNWGWTSLSSISLFLFSTLSLVSFIVWENKTSNPLVELTLFKNLTFSILFSVLLIIQAVGIVFVFWAIFLQNVLYYTPLKAGLLLLPAMLPIIIMAPLGGHLRDKYGPTIPMFWGSLLVILSLIWIGIFCHHQTYPILFPGLLGFGIGMPLILSGIMVTVMNMVKVEQRGIASAILNCSRQFGTSIGLAVLAGLLGSLNKWQLGSFLKHSAAPFSSLQEYQIDGLLVQSDRAMQAVRHLSAQNLHLLKTAAAKAYTTSFSITMFVAALFGLITLTLVSKLPRKK